MKWEKVGNLRNALSDYKFPTRHIKTYVPGEDFNNRFAHLKSFIC